MSNDPRETLDDLIKKIPEEFDWLIQSTKRKKCRPSDGPINAIVIKANWRPSFDEIYTTEEGMKGIRVSEEAARGQRFSAFGDTPSSAMKKALENLLYWLEVSKE